MSQKISSKSPMNEWEFIYSNDKYAAYRIYSLEIPSTLPYDGSLPPQSEAPFIKYESYKNTYIRKQCSFKYANPILDFSDTAGSDSWELTSSGEEECEFTYVKSTPYGCNLTTPTNEGIELTSECECIELSSSSQSSSSSIIKGAVSSASSSDSSSSSSSKSSSLNSSSSEERRSPRNVAVLYLRMIGEPFTDYQYSLTLQDSSASELVWQSASHDVETLTTGTMSVRMNYSGRFFLSATLSVDGNTIVINEALLSNIRNENFSSLNDYLKGISPVESQYITTKYLDVNNYDCVVSYESMEKNNGSNKKLSEIIFDYEMEEMLPYRDSDRVILYINRASLDNDLRSNDICRAWGLFCLTNARDGVWSYQSGSQSLLLEQTDGGNWSLNRVYSTGATSTEEIDIPISFQDVTNNNLSNYDGFFGLTVTNRESIDGGVEISSPSDICNDINTLIVFYSADSCSESSNYEPYNGDLTLTLDGGNWDGKTSYTLYSQSISSNLSVWNWSSDASDGSQEYATLFSTDGIYWKLSIGRVSASGDRSYLYTEFIGENTSANAFVTQIGTIHKSFVSLNGDWSSSNMSFMITEK
jgi:hypothetical protein